MIRKFQRLNLVTSTFNALHLSITTITNFNTTGIIHDHLYSIQKFSMSVILRGLVLTNKFKNLQIIKVVVTLFHLFIFTNKAGLSYVVIMGCLPKQLMRHSLNIISKLYLLR